MVNEVKIVKLLPLGIKFRVLHIEYGHSYNLYLLRDPDRKIIVYNDSKKRMSLIPLTHLCLFKKEKILNSVGSIVSKYTVESEGVVKIFERQKKS